MQSHWMVNQTTYNAVQDTLPLIAKYRAKDGVDNMGKTPVHKVVKKIFGLVAKRLQRPDHYTNSQL